MQRNAFLVIITVRNNSSFVGPFILSYTKSRAWNQYLWIIQIFVRVSNPWHVAQQSLLCQPCPHFFWKDVVFLTITDDEPCYFMRKQTAVCLEGILIAIIYIACNYVIDKYFV